MLPNFDTIRNELRGRSAYLGDGKDVLDGLVWYKTKGFDRVVAQEHVEEYDSSYTQYSSSQGSSKPLEAPSAPPPATLSVIARLSNYRYYLTACSDWHPDFSEATLPLKDVRPSAIAEDPGLPEVAGDFDAAWDVIDELVREMVPDEKEVAQSIGVIDRGRRPYFGLKVGHKIFEKKDPHTTSLVPGEEGWDSDLESDFSIENWPLAYPGAEVHLEKLKGTHITRPIPAYNMAGYLIRPSQYATELKGATVRLEFNLNHWFINSRHVFTADIMRIRVLVPAPPFDTPASKRKRLATMDDFYDGDNIDGDRSSPSPSPSPSKKSRTLNDKAKAAAHGLLSSIKKV